mgnify:CR=1 FL=1
MPPFAPSVVLKLPSSRLTPNSPLVRYAGSFRREIVGGFIPEGATMLVEADREAAGRFSTSEQGDHDVRIENWSRDRDAFFALMRLEADPDAPLAVFHAALFDPALPVEILRAAVLYARLLRVVYAAQAPAFRHPARTLLQPSLLAWADAELDRLTPASELWRTFTTDFERYGVSRGWIVPPPGAAGALRFEADEEPSALDDLRNPQKPPPPAAIVKRVRAKPAPKAKSQ